MGKRDEGADWDVLPDEVRDALDTWLTGQTFDLEHCGWFPAGRTDDPVGLIDCFDEHTGHQQLVVKFYSREGGAKARAWREAFDDSPEEFRRHLAEPVHEAVVLNSWWMTRQRVAGGDLSRYRPITELLHQGRDIAEHCSHIVKSILRDWNTDRTQKPQNYTAGEFLRGILDRRIDADGPIVGNVQAMGFGVDEEDFTFDERDRRLLLNPLRLISDEKWSRSPVDSVRIGRAHRDLSGRNILVRIQPDIDAGDFVLIDTDRFARQEPLVRDPVHLVVALAIDYFVHFPVPENLRQDLLAAIVTPDVAPGETAATVRDLAGVSARIHEVTYAEAGVGHHWRGHYLLALVAAALMHVGRELRTPTPETDRRWCLQLAATAAEEYRRLVTATDSYAPRRAAREPGTVAALPQPVPESGAGPGRLYTAAAETMKAFAIPSISRLHLLEGTISKDGTAHTGRLSFILGEGGLGKTVLLGQLADRLSTAAAAPAVVVLACNRIPPATNLTTPEAVDAAFGAAIGLAGPAPKLRDFTKELHRAHGSVFVLIDTLDLVLTAETAGAVVSVLATAGEHAQSIVTCRVQEYQDLLMDPYTSAPATGDHRTKTIPLPKLNPSEVLAWAERYAESLHVPDSSTARFLASLADQANTGTVREVCAVPLRLALICRLYGDEGKIPSDLTITGLYDAYWERRIAVDRSGRRTGIGRAQETTALWLARTIHRQSRSRLSLTVSENAPDAPEDSLASLVALKSEGAVRYQAGRYEFFHQTYAEYAVARLLNAEATADELNALGTALDDPHSHFWQIARHLLLQKSLDDRFIDLRASVPLFTKEGARYHLLAALDRGSPELLLDAATRLLEHDRMLIVPQIDLLAQATGACAKTALEITVPLLADTTWEHMPRLALTIGELLSRSAGNEREAVLGTAIDHVGARRSDPGIKSNTLLYVFEYLIEESCTATLDSGTAELLCLRYPRLGAHAHQVILRSFTARPEIWPAHLLAAVALDIACPEQLGDDEVVDVLRLCYADPATRRARGWTGWPEMLIANLGARWNNAQIKLVVQLARTPAVRNELLDALLGEQRLPFGDRWVGAGKLVAEDVPVQVAERLAAVSVPLARQAAGTMAALADHLAPHLEKNLRRQLSQTLAEVGTSDPRRTWPARVALAGPDDDLHRLLLHSFTALEPRGVEWPPLVESTVNAWLGTKVPGRILVTIAPELRLLIDAMEPAKVDRTRAMLEGRLARLDPGARQWATKALRTGKSSTVATIVLDGIGRQRQTDARFATDDVAWLLTLTSTKHSHAAQGVAELLMDSEATSDESLIAANARPVVLSRLVQATSGKPDTHLLRKLIRLLSRIDRLDPLPEDAVRPLMATLVSPLKTIPEKLREPRPDTISSINDEFHRWSEALATIAQHRLPADELDALVREAVTGWDSAEVGRNTTDTVSKVLLGRMNDSRAFVLWARDVLWETGGKGTKMAIAKAITVHERTSPTRFSYELAGRADCPPEVAALIHKRLRH